MEAVFVTIRRRMHERDVVLERLNDPFATDLERFEAVQKYHAFIETTNREMEQRIKTYAPVYSTCARIGTVFSITEMCTGGEANVTLWPLASNAVMISFDMEWTFEDEVRDGIPLSWGVNAFVKKVKFRHLFSRTSIPNLRRKQIISDQATMSMVTKAVTVNTFNPYVPTITNRVNRTYAAIVFTRPWSNAPQKFDEYACRLSTTLDIWQMHDVYWDTDDLIKVNLRE